MDQNELLQNSAQHIKDFKLAIEFKYLMKNSPAGVYLLPEFEDIRTLHGVIFVRKGLYSEGIFRFTIQLPISYNDINTHPEVQFTPPIFNPLVDPGTGKLDLKLDELLREWNPEKHFIVTAITFIKKIFYMKNYDGFDQVPNREALTMFKENKDEYLAHVRVTVEESLKRVYDPQPQNCTLIFTESKPAHLDIIKNLITEPSQSIGEKSNIVSSSSANDLPPSESTESQCQDMSLDNKTSTDDHPVDK